MLLNLITILAEDLEILLTKKNRNRDLWDAWKVNRQVNHAQWNINYGYSEDIFFPYLMEEQETRDILTSDIYLTQ